jgi:hypothetical protein
MKHIYREISGFKLTMLCLAMLAVSLVVIPVFASDTSNQQLYFPVVSKPLNRPVVTGINVYYLSPSGNDSNSGLSEGQAWATFERAWQDLYPGDTLILLDGVYYQSLKPNKRSGEPGKPITIRAKNDGKAIIDGEHERTPIALLSFNPSDYYVIEGIVARNGSIPNLPQAVIKISGNHNILRRISAYDAHVDHNTAVISITEPGRFNLLEDCVASGTGRKMINLYKSTSNTVRRCFAYWQQWDGRESCQTWPNGQSIQIYHGEDNIIENSIAIGPIPNTSISIQANSSGALAARNQVLGSIAILAGMNMDNTVKDWGTSRPQPTDCRDTVDLEHIARAGFSLHGRGEIRDNLFQDIFAWGNAGLGLTANLSGDAYVVENNRVNRATLINNGLDNRIRHGGIETDTTQSVLEVFESVENSKIPNIFIEWDSFARENRTMTSMNGEGARLTHRYVDGVLTNEPLWPWPMEDRIQAELGISVTDFITKIIFGANPATDSAELIPDTSLGGSKSEFTLDNIANEFIRRNIR